MKILITGGHIMPALALIDRLLLEKNIEIVFVGRKYNLDSEQSYSLEFQEIERRKIRFIPLSAGRFKKEFSLNSLKNFFRVFLGLFNSFKILSSEKPDLVFSFGSFLGFPFVLTGWMRGVPVFIHEQTLNPGFANRFGGLFAKKNFVSFPQVARFFNKKKVIVSGNPIRKEVFEKNSSILSMKKDLPVIYVTGGSLGSHSINRHLMEILVSLLENSIVIHQTGNVKEYRDFEALNQLRNKLPEKLKKRYFLKEHVYSNEIGNIYHLADLVVGRSGANTFFELVAQKKPAVLIPLPWSANKEQQKQAQLFKLAGVGEIFSQFKESEKLLQLINKMLTNIEKYKKNFINLETLYKKDAVETICQHIQKH